MSVSIRPLTADEARLVTASRLVAVEHAPYLAHALFTARLVAAEGLGTFAVDRGWRLYIDPATLSSWGPTLAGGVLVHEVAHLVPAHAERADALGAHCDHGRHGRRHPLPAILALATAAMLSGARSLYAIGQWGRLQRTETLRALGFTRSATPSVSTLHVVFRGLDVGAFEAALSTWAQARAPNQRTLAIDGKGLRGIHGEELPGVRLVAAYCDEAGLVLAQKGGPVRNTLG